MENNKFSVDEFRSRYDVIRKYVENRYEDIIEYTFKLFAEHMGEEVAKSYCEFLRGLSIEEIGATYLTYITVDNCIKMFEKLADNCELDIEIVAEDYNERIEEEMFEKLG